eukprot:m.209917 g.209917  ORF g.209917 m.209917 type:complete len:276 (+) comp15048_c0_seq28:1355-2182(+)
MRQPPKLHPCFLDFGCQPTWHSFSFLLPPSTPSRCCVIATVFSPVHHAIAVPYIVVALKLVYGLDDAPRANSVERVDQFVKLGVEPLPFWLKRLATLIDRDSTKRASSFASRQLCRDYMKSKSTPSYALPKLVAMVSDLFASVDQPTPPPSPAAANPEGSKSETTPSVEWADTHPELLALQAEYWHTHFLQQPLRLCVYGHADGSEADEVSSIGLPETVHEEYRYVIEALAILFRCPVNRLHMVCVAFVNHSHFAPPYDHPCVELTFLFLFVFFV